MSCSSGKVANLGTANLANLLGLMTYLAGYLLSMQETRSSNPPVVNGDCDSNNS